MAVITGTFDRMVLDAAFNAAPGVDEEGRKIMKYLIAGNVLLVGSVHTHGSTNGISNAYDEIVARFKQGALPNYRSNLKFLERVAAWSKTKQSSSKGRL